MTGKPTYEELEQRVKELENEAIERKRVEDALRESEERFRLLFDRVFDAIVMIDEKGQIADVNQATCRLLGYTKEELLKLSVVDIHPNEEMEKIQAGVSRVLRNGIDYMGDTAFIAKDGRIILVEAGGMTLRIAGKIYIIGSFRDITERKQAEEALRESNETLLTVFNSIDADVYTSDLKSYEVLFMNKHMEDSFGKDLVGKRCYQVFRGEKQPCGYCTNDRLLDANGEPTGVLVWEDQNPVTKRRYRNYDKAIKWIDGRFVRLQVATDITELKQAEEEKEKLQAQLQRAQKMEAIGTLAGGVAHDLNNILAGLVS